MMYETFQGQGGSRNSANLREFPRIFATLAGVSATQRDRRGTRGCKGGRKTTRRERPPERSRRGLRRGFQFARSAARLSSSADNVGVVEELGDLGARVVRAVRTMDRILAHRPGVEFADRAGGGVGTIRKLYA